MRRADKLTQELKQHAERVYNIALDKLNREREEHARKAERSLKK